MVVIFLETTETGNKEVCRLEMIDGQVAISGKRTIAEEFLGYAKRNGIPLEVALNDAPRRYDGAYLRAVVEGAND